MQKRTWTIIKFICFFIILAVRFPFLGSAWPVKAIPVQEELFFEDPGYSKTLFSTSKKPPQQAVKAQTQTARIPLVFAIEKQTLTKYPNSESQIRDTVTNINNRLNSAGILREFYIDHFASSYDKTVVTSCRANNPNGGYLPEEFCNHSSSYVFTVADETTGSNYGGSSIEWHGYNGMFSSQGISVLGHELGHSLGLPDLYLLKVDGMDNHVNGQSFPNPFTGYIMNNLTPGNFSSWDKEIVNRENPSLPIRGGTWIDYQSVQNKLHIVDSLGNPLVNAQVNIYTSTYKLGTHQSEIDAIPEYSGATDTSGNFRLGGNVLGNDPFAAIKEFLIKIDFHGKTDYQWLNFTDFNFPFWAGQTSEATITIISSITKIDDYWPFPPAGSYMEYAEIPMPSPYPTLAPTRFRFDIEKYVNTCASISSDYPTGVPVFRMTQSNLPGRKLDSRRFQDSKNFRMILEWVGDHLHVSELKSNDLMNEQKGTDPFIPLGKLGPFLGFAVERNTGFVGTNPDGSDGLPSFYILPRYLVSNFFVNDFFWGTRNSCTLFEKVYKWVEDISFLDQADLNSGTGSGNLQVGDLHIRFIEHRTDTGWRNREDWFLRKGEGVVRIETAWNKFSDDCIDNYACWQNPNSSEDCICWARRIPPSMITDGIYRIQRYEPHKLSFIIKESGTVSYTVPRGDYFTLKKTSSDYTGYLAEKGRPDQIWKAHQLNPNGETVFQDMWFQDGETKIYVPADYPLGTVKGSFRSWIWSKPDGETAADGETTIEPSSYPDWSDDISVTIIPNMETGWNRIIWPDIVGKTVGDMPSGCSLESENGGGRFNPYMRGYFPINTSLIPSKTYFFSCRESRQW